MAQWLTHLIRNEKIPGSNPGSGLSFYTENILFTIITTESYIHTTYTCLILRTPSQTQITEYYGQVTHNDLLYLHTIYSHGYIPESKHKYQLYKNNYNYKQGVP